MTTEIMKLFTIKNAAKIGVCVAVGKGVYDLIDAFAIGVGMGLNKGLNKWADGNLNAGTEEEQAKWRAAVEGDDK